jgi:hypothetical protein
VPIDKSHMNADNGAVIDKKESSVFDVQSNLKGSVYILFHVCRLAHVIAFHTVAAAGVAWDVDRPRGQFTMPGVWEGGCFEPPAFSVDNTFE